MEGLNVDTIHRLDKDLRVAARALGAAQARYMVSAYYIHQEQRKRTEAQVRALEAAGEPSDLIGWQAAQSRVLEKQIVVSLDLYTENHPVGGWMRSIYGIGPVLAAGLLAHIDITRTPTAGHIWQFAGIAGDNQRKWEKGQRRPFNAELKVLCWKVGQCFMKFSNRDECYYGGVYRARKEYETRKNEAGEYAAIASEAAKRVGKSTEAYKAYAAGKLPAGHIDARSRRYAVKLFLSHLHHEWYTIHYGKEPPNPYPIAMLGHAHYIAPPSQVV